MLRKPLIWAGSVLLVATLWLSRDWMLEKFWGTPRTVKGNISQGIWFLGKMQTGNAILAFDRALQLDDKSVESRYLLAQTLEGAGRTEEAVREYRQVIKESPNLAAPHFNLAMIYRVQSKFKEAEAEFKEAVRLFPDFTAAHLQLGTIYYNREDWENAYTELSVAVKHPGAILTDKVSLHAMLGRTNTQLGRTDEAVEHWKTVRQLDPKNREAEQQLNALTKR